MPMYNLIEYSDNYSKTYGSLLQYLKDIPTVNNAADIIDFTTTNTTDSFKFKTKITVCRPVQNNKNNNSNNNNSNKTKQNI